MLLLVAAFGMQEISINANVSLTDEVPEQQIVSKAAVEDDFVEDNVIV